MSISGYAVPAATLACFAVTGAVALIASPIGKRATALIEATEQATAAQYDAEIHTGRLKAADADSPLGCAQACAQLLHSQLAFRPTPADYPAITFAATLYARLGHDPEAAYEQQALGFDIERTPRLTVAACLAHAIGRARDRAYEAGHSEQGSHLVAALGFLRPEITNRIDGGDRLVHILNRDEAAFWAKRRPEMLAGMRTPGGARS